MHRGLLTMIGGLALLGCGDDTGSTGSTSDSSGTTSSSSGSTDEGTTEEPMETTAADTTGADSTGPGAVCGNGVLEDGEECDDANLLDDDDCYSNCMIPYEELWTAVHDDGGDEFALDAQFDGSGNLYVLGASQVGGEDFDLWLRQYLPDGSEGWTWTYDGPLGGDDFGDAMVWHTSGDLMIVGNQTSDQGDDILVIRFDVDSQSVVWSDTFDGPDMGLMGLDNDFGDGLMVDDDGSVLVAGSYREPGQEWDLWLRRYDEAGNELWTVTHDEAMMVDSSQTVLVDAAGDIYHVANVEVAAGDFDAWIRKLDSGGNEIWTNTIGGVRFRGATLDPNDDLVLVGIDTESGTAPDVWVGKYDPDFNVLGNTSLDVGGSFDFGWDVRVGGSGDVYVSGTVTVVGEQGQAWAARYQPDLSLRRWSHQYGNDRAHLEDDAYGVAVTNDEGRVAMVGRESVLGQGENIWVRVLSNGMPPS